MESSALGRKETAIFAIWKSSGYSTLRIRYSFEIMMSALMHGLLPTFQAVKSDAKQDLCSIGLMKIW